MLISQINYMKWILGKYVDNQRIYWYYDCDESPEGQE